MKKIFTPSLPSPCPGSSCVTRHSRGGGWGLEEEGGGGHYVQHRCACPLRVSTPMSCVRAPALPVCPRSQGWNARPRKTGRAPGGRRVTRSCPPSSRRPPSTCRPLPSTTSFRTVTPSPKRCVSPAVAVRPGGMGGGAEGHDRKHPTPDAHWEVRFSTPGAGGGSGKGLN